MTVSAEQIGQSELCMLKAIHHNNSVLYVVKLVAKGLLRIEGAQ